MILSEGSVETFLVCSKCPVFLFSLITVFMCSLKCTIPLCTYSHFYYLFFPASCLPRMYLEYFPNIFTVNIIRLSGSSWQEVNNPLIQSPFQTLHSDNRFKKYVCCCLEFFGHNRTYRKQDAPPRNKIRKQTYILHTYLAARTII